MTLNAPMREWMAELGPRLPVSDVLGVGMGWVRGEEWQGMERQWHLHKFWGNYRGDLWEESYVPPVHRKFWHSTLFLTHPSSWKFLQLSTIAIHNTATGRCIPPERTRARICRIIFWDHQWKLMNMHNKEISSPFSSPLIYFTRLLLTEGWLCVLPSFQTQGTQKRKHSCPQTVYIHQGEDRQSGD